MHTAQVSACAVSTAAEQVARYKDCGYTGIIVTDHFINGNSTCPRHLPWQDKMAFFAAGYEAAKEAGAECGLDVFFGWEYSLRGTDLLTYGLGMDFLLANPGMDKLSIQEYSALVRANGGYLAQAHPFRYAAYIQNPFPVQPEYLDGLEVYNASMPDEVNSQAFVFAKNNGLPMQAGSDAHNASLPYFAGVWLDKKANGVQDIITAVKSGRVKLALP